MRAVIWIIVGILVVAAVAFVLVTKSQQTGTAGKLTPADIGKKAEYFTKQADGIDADVKNLTAKLSSKGKLDDASNALLAGMTAKAVQMREKAKVLQGQTGDLKAATATKGELQDILKDVNKNKATLQKRAK
jgi:hypothetical protein